MSTPPPIHCVWDGEAFAPAPRFAKLCDEHFVIGESYPLEVHEERSTKTHNHEFGWLREAWLSLPENIAADFPTPEHLRKRALIEANFYDEQIVDAGTQAAALRVCSAFRAREEFAYVVTRGPIVVIRTAKSQSRRVMDKAEFQASKTAIMEVVAGMLGVTPEQVGRAAA
ncbi:hypothetical protein [Methylopila sp. 73B]|uniref:hypothetical protein n=1 Tax=Methylopila sp. 73B TaxID=1120792 RepID=UPI000375F804|nr:hypothetical protein [Methylopila sp. 73B]